MLILFTYGPDDTLNRRSQKLLNVSNTTSSQALNTSELSNSESVALNRVEPGSTVELWTRWEISLTSSKTYANPYNDVTVSATYTAPSGKTHTAYGFWDEGNTFRLRFMFTEVGNWSWATTCTDIANTCSANIGLNQSGHVFVSGYSGTNPLYKKGYLKLSDDRRYLVHHNGEPFFWMADTAWMAPIKATYAQWVDYVGRRKRKNFNVIQVNIISGFSSLKKDALGNKPFTGSGTRFRMNPAFWRELDKKVQYANKDHGVIVFITGGLGFPSDTISVKRLARDLAARMRGNFVVFSPTADLWWTALHDTYCDELRASSDTHLITAHPEMWPATAARTFHGKPYTDFAGLQTSMGWQSNPHGHSPDHWGPGGPFSGHLASQYAIEAPLALLNRVDSLNRIKPVINLEVVYDLQALHKQSFSFEKPYPSRLVRSTAYLSLLSGSKGITYGVGGVWNWGVQGVAGVFGSGWDLSTAMNQPSATHMQYLYQFFSSIRWWTLQPAHHVITNQPADALRRMVLAKSSDNKFAVAYLPDNANIQIDTSSFPTAMRARWLNPATNECVPSPATISGGGVKTFTKPPAFGDAILHLTAQATSLFDFSVSHGDNQSLRPSSCG